MARGSKRRTRRRRPVPGALARALAAVPRPRWGTVGPVAGWLLAAAALFAAWVSGVPRLQAALAAADGGPVTVAFENLPAWVNGDLLAMLQLTARRQITADPFRRADLSAARRALMNTGWFDAVAQVRRRRGDRVTVSATFVTPAAVVRDADGDHLVDPRGRLLPRTYPRGGAEHQLVLTGVHFDRPQRPGAQWDGADLSAALRLLRAVEGRTWRDQVAAIDAGDFLRSGTLLIRTDHGATIVWGSPPGEEKPLEIGAQRKLAYLDKAYETFQRIDTGHRGTLRFDARGYFAE